LQWLPLLLLSAVAGYWLWDTYRVRQRRPAVAWFASQNGLSDSGNSYVGYTGYDFPLLRVRTTKGFVDQILHVVWAGVRESGGKSQRRRASRVSHAR
jgi:hypothetical protein